MDLEQYKKAEARSRRRLKKGLAPDTVDLLAAMEREKYDLKNQERLLAEVTETKLIMAEEYLWT